MFAIRVVPRQPERSRKTDMEEMLDVRQWLYVMLLPTNHPLS